MSDIKIRRATIEDIELILSFAERLQRFHTNLDPYYGVYDKYEDHRSFYGNELKNDERLYLIASISERDVAFASASIIHIDDEDAPKIGYLIAIFVEEEFRGRGVGTLLYKKRMEWLREHNVAYVEMSVDVRNEKVLKMYEEKGFHKYKVHLVKEV